MWNFDKYVSQMMVLITDFLFLLADCAEHYV